MKNYLLAILDSGNYVFNLCRTLENKGYVFEVIATPCQIAKSGCGYCLKFPDEYKDLVVEQATENGFKVREIYKISSSFAKNIYEKII